MRRNSHAKEKSPLVSQVKSQKSHAPVSLPCTCTMSGMPFQTFVDIFQGKVVTHDCEDRAYSYQRFVLQWISCAAGPVLEQAIALSTCGFLCKGNAQFTSTPRQSHIFIGIYRQTVEDQTLNIWHITAGRPTGPIIALRSNK